MFLGCGDIINDLINDERHLIKKYQIFCLEKLSSRELYNMLLILNIENPLIEYISRKNFKTLNWNGKIYVPYLDMQRLIQIFAYFSINYYIIFYILTKCFMYLEKRYSHFSFIAWKKLKAQFTFFSFAQKQTFSRRRYNIFSKM